MIAARSADAGSAADPAEEAAAGLGREAPRRPDKPSPRARPASVRSQLFELLLYVGAPITLYYGLRSGGVADLMALGVGAAVPGVGAAVKIVRDRKVDKLAAVVMATMLASIGVSLITGSTRLLLAKDGLITGAWGLTFLVSVGTRRPAAFLITRPLLEGRRAFTAGSWDVLWEGAPRFRRIWRVSTLMWGLGLIGDAGIRVAAAYTLPVAVVPALGGAVYPATFVVLQIITNIYYHRSGLWTLLGASWVRFQTRRDRFENGPGRPVRPST